MQIKWELYLAFALTLGTSWSCGHQGTTDPSTTLNRETLRRQTFSFTKETRLIAESGTESTAGEGGGLYEPSTFSVGAYKPSTFLVLPARAAAYYQQEFGAPEGFKYQTFSFVSSSCNASDAFSRYFAAIEAISGSTLKPADQEKVGQSFDTVFSGIGAEGSDLRCLLFDLISCIADYVRFNAPAIQQGATGGGDFAAISTGALSCISEVFGPDVAIPTLSTSKTAETPQ